MCSGSRSPCDSTTMTKTRSGSATLLRIGGCRRSTAFEMKVDDRSARLLAQHDQHGPFGRPDGQGGGLIDEVLVSAKPPAGVGGQDLRRLLFHADRAGNRQIALGK